MIIISLALSLLHAQSSLLLQQNTTVDVQKLIECSKLTNDLQRLVCYDALLAGPSKKTIKAPHSTFGLKKSHSSVKAPKKPNIKPNLTKNPQTSDKPSSMEELLTTFLKKDKNITRATFEIASQKKSSNGAYLFTMEDGSIWKQTDAYRRAINKAPYSATISKGNFGSYILKPKKGSWSVRVKRIK